MRAIVGLFSLLGAFASSIPALAQNTDLTTLRQEAERFLQQQTESIGKDVEITIGSIDPRLKLKLCEKPIAFLTPGSKAWGKIMLGMRCESPSNWSIYIPAQVKVFGDYLVIKNAVSQGQILTPQDIISVRGELSHLPPGTIFDVDAIAGKTMQVGLPAGTSLRKDMFKVIPIIQQGQAVKVMSSGVGFRVTNDAVAMNNAGEGQIAKAKTNSGQLIVGIAKSGGIIEVN